MEDIRQKNIAKVTVLMIVVLAIVAAVAIISQQRERWWLDRENQIKSKHPDAFYSSVPQTPVERTLSEAIDKQGFWGTIFWSDVVVGGGLLLIVFIVYCRVSSTPEKEAKFWEQVASEKEKMREEKYKDRYVKWLSAGQSPENAEKLARQGLEPKKKGQARVGVGFLFDDSG